MVYHGAYSQDCQTYLGSRDYRAPEVVRLGINRKKTSGDQGGYGKPADMWSLGAPLMRNLASPEVDFPLMFRGIIHFPPWDILESLGKLWPELEEWSSM